MIDGGGWLGRESKSREDRQTVQGLSSHLCGYPVHSGLERNLIHPARKQHTTFSKDLMNGSKKWRRAKESSWAVLSDHAKKKKKKKSLLRNRFWVYLAQCNKKCFPVTSPPKALTLLCKPWERALSQAWAQECLTPQAEQKDAPSHPCQRLPAQIGQDTTQLQRE